MTEQMQEKPSLLKAFGDFIDVVNVHGDPEGLDFIIKKGEHVSVIVVKNGSFPVLIEQLQFMVQSK